MFCDSCQGKTVVLNQPQNEVGNRRIRAMRFADDKAFLTYMLAQEKVEAQNQNALSLSTRLNRSQK